MSRNIILTPISKKKKKKSKGERSEQDTPCEELPHLKGPIFGSKEFIAAYCNKRWEKGGKGICGPAAVALAIGVKDGKGFKKILNDWKRDIGFDGIALVRDVKARLLSVSFPLLPRDECSKQSYGRR
jgi:hypothetical protein